MKTLLPQRLRDLRIDKQLSQVELAMILGISNSTLSQYENGVNTPNDMMKVQIADYFDITIDYLVGRTNIKRYPSTNEKQFIDVDGLSQDNIDFVKLMVDKLRNRR